MLRERVLSAALGAPIILLGLFLSPAGFAVVLGVIALVCAWELRRIFENLGLQVFTPVAFAGILLYLGLALYKGDTFTGYALIWLLAGSALFSVSTPSPRRLANFTVNLFVGLYLGFLLSRLLILRIEPFGLELALAVLMAVWASDIAAYFGGKAFGKRPLAPQISPKKTVEGAVVGLIAAMLAAMLVGAGYGIFTEWWLFLGMVVSLAGLMGDLFESKLKRMAGVKDSGSILPGHGGLLDRFDSLLFAGAAGYYLVRFLPF